MLTFFFELYYTLTFVAMPMAVPHAPLPCYKMPQCRPQMKSRCVLELTLPYEKLLEDHELHVLPEGCIVYVVEK